MIITQYMQSKYGIGNSFANLLKIAIDCLSLKKVDSLNTSYYVYLSNDTKR